MTETEGDDKSSPWFCDEQGRLDISAVGDYPNMTEMFLIINEGIKMEVLSYKIHTEEPKACSLISNALNKFHEAALKTTELTALNCLTGEISFQFETKLVESITFDSVKENVRKVCVTVLWTSLCLWSCLTLSLAWEPINRLAG